jgi:pyruvate-ferredoxin/flavodoxin oxidoreductase
LEVGSSEAPSLLIAFCRCIGRDFDLRHGLEKQKKSVQNGHWPLCHFDSRIEIEDANWFGSDSKSPMIGSSEYVGGASRVSRLQRSHPERA